MVGDADTGLLKEIDDGPTAGAIESRQMVGAIDRYGEVDVAALVEDFDSVAPEGLEAGHLSRQRPGQRAEQRDRADFRNLGQVCRYHVRRAPECGLPREHEPVLFRDLSTRGLAGHGSAAVLSARVLRRCYIDWRHNKSI